MVAMEDVVCSLLDAFARPPGKLGGNILVVDGYAVRLCIEITRAFENVLDMTMCFASGLEADDDGDGEFASFLPY